MLGSDLGEPGLVGSLHLVVLGAAPDDVRHGGGDGLPVLSRAQVHENGGNDPFGIGRNLDFALRRRNGSRLRRCVPGAIVAAGREPQC